MTLDPDTVLVLFADLQSPELIPELAQETDGRRGGDLFASAPRLPVNAPEIPSMSSPAPEVYAPLPTPCRASRLRARPPARRQVVRRRGVNVGVTALAGAVALIPRAPLMAISLSANLLTTILMPSALVFLLLLSNDRSIMGRHVNGLLANWAGVAITALVTLAGGAYAVVGLLSVLGVKII